MFQDYEQKPAGRPTFLTILCILTFVGSGLGLINGVYQFVTAEKAAQEMVRQNSEASAEIQKSGKDDAGTKFAGKMINSVSKVSADDLKKGGVLAILAAIVCISGAFMMWKLRRIGYYVYIAGILIGIVSPFVVFGSSNLAAIIGSTVTGFIGIAFIILYGVNVKHLR